MDYSAIKMKLSVVRGTLSQLIDQLDELFEEAWDANNLIKTWQTDYPNKNPLPVIEVASSVAEVVNKETGSVELIISPAAGAAPGPIKIPKKFKKKNETPSIN
jgi:hypothetical protein